MTWERAGRGTARQHHAHVARPLLQRLENPLYFFSRVQLDLREFREAEAAISSIFLLLRCLQKRPKVPCLLLLTSTSELLRQVKLSALDPSVQGYAWTLGEFSAKA